VTNYSVIVNIILLRIFPLKIFIREKCLENENDKYQKSLSRPSIIDAN
jgi:hypothetical protein